MQALLAPVVFLFTSLPPEEAVSFDWTRFGRIAGQAMPAAMREGPALGQLHYVAERVADKLLALGVTPNYDQAGRASARARFNDSSLGTCGYLAECVKLAAQAAGVPESCLKIVVVLK